MLTLKLNSLDGLAADIAKEYKKVGDVYVLDTDVQFEDVTPLKNALAQEKQHRKEATTKVTALETQVADLAARTGNASDLEKSWKEKLDKVEKAAEERQKNLNAQVHKLLVENVAQGLAGEISTVPDVLLPHIQKRLAVEEVDGQFVTRVLTADGKASAQSVGELKAEFLANKNFAPILTASKATGGGANGGKGDPGGKAFGDMNEGERVNLFKTNRAEYDRQSAEHKAKQAQPPA